MPVKKKSVKKKVLYPRKQKKKDAHPSLSAQLTVGQKAADKLTTVAGSWVFIIGVLVFLILWMIVNVIGFIKHWDPFPFILLNLFLSMLAAIQAPVILMSQNRQSERDRINAKYDYQVNRKSEREIQEIRKSVDSIKRFLNVVEKKRK